MPHYLAKRLTGIALGITLASIGLAQDGEQAREELEAVTAAIADIESWLDDANGRQTGALQRLREAELEISQLQQSIAELQTAIDNSNTELNSLGNRQSELEQQRQSQEALLAEILRAAYMSGEHNTLKLMLSGEGPSEAARMLHYSSVLSQHQLQRIDEFRQTLASLEEVESQLNEELINLQNRQQAFQEQSVQLNNARDERAAALENLNSDIARRSQELEQLQIDQAELEALLQEIARAMEGIRSFDDVPAIADYRGQLASPVSGPWLARFGSSYGGGSLIRQGIVIGASEGSAVRAVHPGRVVFADWLRGAGLLVILDHGDAYMSLYGRNEALAVSAGDWVDAGDVLATSGRGGEGNSPGLYFEIRHHGAALNPADWIANQ